MEANVEPSIFEFCAKFCNKLDKMKNFAFSPLAVAEITMAVISLDTICSADADNSKIIQIPKDDKLPSSYLFLSSKLNSVKGVTLNQANKIYLTKSFYKISRKHKKNFKEIFNIKIQNLSFTRSDYAAKCINKWVEKKTKKKLNGLLSCNDLEADTNLVLISGLHFKGIWQMKFDPEDTEEAIFYLNDKEIVNVFLMYRKERYRYRDSINLGAKMLLLPFKGEEAQMLIVLPKLVNGLDGVLQKLADGYDLMAEVDGMSTETIIVQIPRFKIESEINFADVLHKLGIHTTCNKAIQKVLIEVTEEGTERKFDPNDDYDFRPRRRAACGIFTADHPHLIVILCHNIPIAWVTFRGLFE